MSKICFYFQLHQPFRLSNYSIFDINNSEQYFDDADGGDANRQILEKVSQKSYLPMLQLLLRLTKRLPTFRCALSCSGVFLEQVEQWQPEVLQLLQQLAATGKVEFLAETYYHSLAALYSKKEFFQQVADRQRKLQQLFGVTPKVFRNTELIYSNDIAELVTELGYLGMLTEGVDRYLSGRPRTQVYVDTKRQLPLLLKHAQLSDDLAFRFSDKSWSEFPLSAEKYLYWTELFNEDELLNLFMDFETFGEHQWADTGIFAFFEHFVEQFLAREWNQCVTPTQVFSDYYQKQKLPVYSLNKSIWRQLLSAPVKVTARTGLKLGPVTKVASLPIYDVPQPISWADVDRDLTAWLANSLQQDTLHKLYEIEGAVLAGGDLELISRWRKLQTSDHFYYMCVKWSADGDVHAYFSPYDDPFEAYRRFSIVLADVRGRV